MGRKVKKLQLGLGFTVFKWHWRGLLGSARCLQGNPCGRKGLGFRETVVCMGFWVSSLGSRAYLTGAGVFRSVEQRCSA